MKKLVIHADDFGFSEGINRGILTAIERGVVTSTSLLANFSHSRSALLEAGAKNIDLGWHINLTQGRPVSDPENLPSLVREDGAFHPLGILIRKCLLRRINPEDVKRELEAQWEVFRSAEVRPSHADGHQHIHVFPVIREAVRDIIARHLIPFVRAPRESGGPRASRFAARSFLRLMKGSHRDFWAPSGAESIAFRGLTLGIHAGNLANWEKLLTKIARTSKSVFEIMVHPGFSTTSGKDLDHHGHDDYKGNREAELRLLTHPDLRTLIQRMQFTLVSFKDLRK
jgi:predicted glycoside hydrolase/deacetylase ChbG (UPF0249 family)